MKLFFSCDWGTSAFRLRLVDVEKLTILATVKTDEGIAKVFKNWKQHNPNGEHRMAFYQRYIVDAINSIVQSYKGSCNNAPIIISGMACSSIGMLELPYKPLPFSCKGTDLVIKTIPPDENNAYKMIIISGASSTKDAIRGEETMLIGCNILNIGLEQLYIFPGTHSKHILVKKGLVKNISTYITGELFDLLSNKSILSNSVKKNEQPISTGKVFFEEGVRKGASLNLLNAIFQVRINQLFQKANPAENYHFLSGLLLGYELKEVVKNKSATITLVCGGELKDVYTQALEILGISKDLNYQDADEVLIRGQKIIMDHYK